MGGTGSGGQGGFSSIPLGISGHDLTAAADIWNGMANDGEFSITGTTFTHNGEQKTLGATGNGVAAKDNATGTGYILYSEESVHTRFAAVPPHAANADHLIAVKLVGGQWHYDNNNANK